MTGAESSPVLDPSQLRAANAPPGTLNTITGSPGTGKTATIRARSLALAEHFGTAERLILISPDPGLAAEWRRWVARRRAQDERPPLAGSPAQLAARILRWAGTDAGAALGLAVDEMFTVLASAEETTGLRDAAAGTTAPGSSLRLNLEDADTLLAAARLEAGRSSRPGPLASRAKGHLVRLESPAGGAAADRDGAELLAAWEAYRRRAGLLDATDLALLPVRLLEARPDLAATVDAILVDDAHRLSESEARFVDLVRGPPDARAPITITLDPNQTIGSPRGVSVQAAERRANERPRADLRRGYRLPPGIAHMAAKAIAGNRSPGARRTRAKPGRARPVRVCELANDLEEAAWIAQSIERANAPPEGFAVLAPDRALLAPIASELARHRIATATARDPGTGPGVATAFAAWLSLLVNPGHHPAVYTLLAGAGAGGATLELVRQTAHSTGRTAAEAAILLARSKSLPARPATEALRIGRTLEELLRQAEGGAGVASLVGELLSLSGIKSGANATDDDHTRDEALGALAELERAAASEPSLARLQERLTLAPYRPDTAPAVLLATVEQAPGIEREHVLLAGCEEGLLPAANARSRASLEEERRYLYVAATRASRSFTATVVRARAGRQRTRSRFLAELGDAVEWHDLRHRHASTRGVS